MEKPQIKMAEAAIISSSSIEEYRKWRPNSMPFVNFKVPFLKSEEDYTIFRGKDWYVFPKLKTLIVIPGTAFIDHSLLISDVVYPGMLSFMPPGHQIIVLLHPIAPQHKFPAPLLHLERTLSHLLQNSERYLIDKEYAIFGGYSSGAAMSIPLAIAMAKKGVFFRNVVSMAPVLDFSGELRKWEELKQWEEYELRDQKSLGPDFINLINEHYSRSAEDLRDPRYSPVFTSPQDLSLLRNFVLIYGENDFMRRAIEAFKAKLAKAGVDCQWEIVKGNGTTFCFSTRTKDQCQANRLQSFSLRKNQRA